MDILAQQTRTLPASEAPASARVGLSREPSADALMASMLGEAPADEEKKVRPAKAADTAKQGDRQERRASPGGAASDEEIEEEDTSSILEEGEGDAPTNDDDDEADAQDAGDDADEGDADEGDADPLDDDLFADHEGDDEGEGDEFDASKLGDNVKLSVTVDGEEQEVTLGDLKRRYAGEGAIEKRLQEATEFRKHAQTDYDKGKDLVMGVLQTMGQAMFRRTVQAPTEALLRSNPTQYLLQKDAYERESAALQQQQGQIESMISQLDQQREERMRQERQTAAQQLRKMMPILADPAKGPRVRDALVSAAKEIGYTDEQIAACTDPLMFKTVALAARELRRSKGVQVKKAAETTRTLAARGSQNRNTERVDAKAREKKVLQRAAKDPSEVNLMETMLAPAPKKPKRR